MLRRLQFFVTKFCAAALWGVYAIQQTSSKFIQNTRANAGRLLDRVNTLLGSFPRTKASKRRKMLRYCTWLFYIHYSRRRTYGQLTAILRCLGYWLKNVVINFIRAISLQLPWSVSFLLFDPIAFFFYSVYVCIYVVIKTTILVNKDVFSTALCTLTLTLKKF